MKNITRLVVASLLVALSGVDTAAGTVSFGAKAGFGFFNITETPEEWEDAKSFKTGFSGGAFLNYALSGAFSLQPELLYCSKGVMSNLYDGFVVVDVTASFDYIELPVLAKYSFLERGKFRPCIYAGPSVAYAIASELEIEAGILGASVDFSSLTHVSDFGMIVGVGFDYDIGDGTVTFDARFQRGFTNVIMSGDFEINGSTQTISGDDFKNYGFTCMVGYLF
jgi:hypothetical protein